MDATDKIFARTKEEFLEFYTWCNKFRKICRKETGKDIMSSGGYPYIGEGCKENEIKLYVDK